MSRDKDIRYLFVHKTELLPAFVWLQHYCDVIMSSMASQITCVSIVYSTVCLGAYQRKHQSSMSLAFVRGMSPVTIEFPAQRASDAENVSSWWRHLEKIKYHCLLSGLKIYILIRQKFIWIPVEYHHYMKTNNVVLSECFQFYNTA